MHQTKDLNDDYMGSGKLIKAAILKYGVENFTKEILHVFDNEEDMKLKEKELVVISENSYNLCDGGHGGFGYINRNPDKFLTEKKLSCLMSPAEALVHWKQKYQTSEEFRNKHREITKLAHQKSREKYPQGTFFGKKHSEETKSKMRKSRNVGEKNSQFGTCWVTNGTETKKIRKEELDNWLSLGYYKGRSI